MNEINEISTQPSAKQDALTRIKEQFPFSPAAKALDLVNSARRRDYGHPRDNFASIAKAWNNYLTTKYRHSQLLPALGNEDVAMMMVLMKIMRQAITPKFDNLVDIAGYAECAFLAQQSAEVFGGLASATPEQAAKVNPMPKRNLTQRNVTKGKRK
jgi:hypothetical protein